jgi:hypothetical protein
LYVCAVVSFHLQDYWSGNVKKQIYGVTC